MALARFILWLCLVSIVLTGAGVVSGQEYPAKPIRIIASGQGGSPDFAARLIAQFLSGPLGQQVVVENRSSGVIPGDTVAKSQPDGYTLLVAGGTFWLGPLLRETPYDPVRDFSPISLTNRAPNVLVVNPSLPVTSVKGLIALAKARPGQLSYYTNGTGSSTHIASELLKSMAGINMLRVNYKAAAQGLTDLMSGQVQVAFANAASATPHVRSGRLRALAIGSAEPSALAPGLPTVAASGVPGYEASSINGIFAPAKTPVATINRLHQEIVRVLNRADVKEKFFNTGAESVGSSPEQLAATVKSEMARIGKVIQDGGIKPD